MLAGARGGNFKSFCVVNQMFKRFWLFFSIGLPRHTKKETKQQGKIVRVQMRVRVMQTLY